MAQFCKIWWEFLWWRDFGGHFAWIALKIKSSWPPCKVLEIKPRGVKDAAPIMHHAINNCAAVQLGASCLKNEVCINIESFKSALGYLKSMCMLKNRHAWLDLGVLTRCQQACDLDGNEVLGDKGYFMHLQGNGRGGHSKFFGWWSTNYKTSLRKANFEQELSAF